MKKTAKNCVVIKGKELFKEASKLWGFQNYDLVKLTDGDNMQIDTLNCISLKMLFLVWPHTYG